MMEYVFVDDLHRYKRLKVTRACESCRRRKVKCDGGSGGTQTPCSSCRKLKIECIFSNMAVKRAHPKTEQEQMDERSQRIENILHKLDEEDSAKGKRGVLDTVKICQTGRAQYIYNAELSKTDPKRCDFSDTVVFAEPPLPFVGFSNPPVPSPELTNNLVQLYFHHIHPYVPVLHKANFLRRLNNKDGNNPVSPLLLYAVLAIASKFSEDPAVRTDPMDPDTAGLAYYNKAKDLQDEFFDTPRLSTVQALILMLKYQEGIRRPGFFYRSWVHFGTITRMVQDPGLNRSFDKYSYPISNEDMIARKRVWQVCFLCDQFMSGAQGRDVVISLSQADIDLPLKEEYGDDEEEFELQTNFVHLVRLAKILASVMTVIAPAGSGSPLQPWNSNPKLQTLDQALEAWYAALPQRLQCTRPSDPSTSPVVQPIESHFSGFLNILYHTIVILLHRPYVTNFNRAAQPNHHHLNICSAAANSISQIAQLVYEKWGPLVFQYPLRGGNYGVYCLVSASMIHLVNMTSPDVLGAKTAHDHLLRTLGVLRICVEHSAATELCDKVAALEVAFTAQQARQSAMPVLFNQGANPAMDQVNGLNYVKRRHMQRRRQTGIPGSHHHPTGAHMISSSLPNLSLLNQTPQFHERSLFALPEDQGMPPTFTTDAGHAYDFMNAPLDENSSLLTSSMGNIPLTPPMTVPNSEYNSIMSMNNPKSIDMNGGTIDPNSTYWDSDQIYLLNQINQNQQNIWSGSGTISPISISTSPVATPSLTHSQASPSYNAAHSAHSKVSSAESTPLHVPHHLPTVIDPVLVASQNQELLLGSDSNGWFMQ